MTDCKLCTSATICTECKNNKFLDSDGKGCHYNCNTEDSNSIILYLKI